MKKYNFIMVYKQQLWNILVDKITKDEGLHLILTSGDCQTGVCTWKFSIVGN